MQLLADQPLPPGLWLLKWIDRFSFHHGSQSAHVELWFEKLDVVNVATFQALTIEKIQVLLPRPRVELNIFTSIRVQAALLPMLFVGDVFEDTVRVGQLRTADLKVRVKEPRSLLVRDVALTAPPGWRAGNYRVINGFEFGLPPPENDIKSRCLVFEWDGTQYILPKVVIFRTFYGLHTRLIEAILKGWPSGVRNVLSFANLDSGLTTAIDPSTLAWKVLLQPGIRDWMAAPIAFYWFDPHAKETLTKIHTNHLRQNEGVVGSAGRHFFMDADIPYPLGDDGFEIKIQGFPLRRFSKDPSQGPDRFLVTAITGHEQKTGEQVILVEHFNSNAVSENHTVDENAAEPAYSGFKVPVAGLDDALAASMLQADACEPKNQFNAPSVATWPNYNLGKQVKNSSATRITKPPLASDGPSPIVSGGNETYGTTPAAPAEISQRIRDHSKQFEFLIAALEHLLSTDRIVAFDVVAAPTKVQGGGIDRSFWSFDLGERKGWTFIKDAKPKGTPVTGHARTVLVTKVELRQAVVVLLEIEASSPSTGNQFYAWPDISTDLEADVLAVIDRMIPVRGSLDDRDLERAIGVPITGFIHHFRYESVDAAVTGNTDVAEPDAHERSSRTAVGLREDLLLRGLVRAAKLPPKSEASVDTVQS